MKDTLEKQLHEQYAINNNANVSSFIAMIGSLIAAFTGYGYVVNQYLMNKSKCCHCSCNHTFNSNTMLELATAAVLVVIFILYIVAIEIGAGQRSNQFVIHRIREKAYDNRSEFIATYHSGYSPEGKTYVTFIQGIYNSFSWIFFGIYLAIVVYSCIEFNLSNCWITVYCILGLYMLNFRYSKFKKYQQMCGSDSHKRLNYFDSIIFLLVIVSLCIFALHIDNICLIRCSLSTICFVSTFRIINIIDNK